MGWDAKLPLTKDPFRGWTEVETAKEAVKQDLNILLLTSPGEKIMAPEFGVGLRRFLFEPVHRMTFGAIESRIRQQVSKYLSFIDIQDISFSSALDVGLKNAGVVTDVDENAVSVKISYSFGRGFYDELSVSPQYL